MNKLTFFLIAMVTLLIAFLVYWFWFRKRSYLLKKMGTVADTLLLDPPPPQRVPIVNSNRNELLPLPRNEPKRQNPIQNVLIQLGPKREKLFRTREGRVIALPTNEFAWPVIPIDAELFRSNDSGQKKRQSHQSPSRHHHGQRRTPRRSTTIGHR